MDDLINEIINYVSETPENTNNRILRPMLERLGNSSSSPGGGGGLFIQETTDATYGYVNMTDTEIEDAIAAGKAIWLKSGDNYYLLASCFVMSNGTQINFDMGGAALSFGYYPEENCFKRMLDP